MLHRQPPFWPDGSIWCHSNIFLGDFRLSNASQCGGFIPKLNAQSNCGRSRALFRGHFLFICHFCLFIFVLYSTIWVSCVLKGTVRSFRYLLSVHVHGHACVCTCVYTCLSFVWSLLIRLGCLATESHGSACLCHPNEHHDAWCGKHFILVPICYFYWTVTKVLKVEKYHYIQWVKYLAPDSFRCQLEWRLVIMYNVLMTHCSEYHPPPHTHSQCQRAVCVSLSLSPICSRFLNEASCLVGKHTNITRRHP